MLPAGRRVVAVRVLNRFGDTTNGGAYPAGQTLVQSPNFRQTAPEIRGCPGFAAYFASTKPYTTNGMAQAGTGRRDFLKAAGAAALTSSIFTGDLKGANDKGNIGFIKVGQMGSGN